MPDRPWLRRLFQPAASRDGQAHAVEDEAFAAGRKLADDGTGHPARRQVAHPDTIVTAALAQKLLLGWMQNRFQTRYPLALNLRHQAPAEAELLGCVVRYALQTLGAGEDETRRAAAWLQAAGGQLPDQAMGSPLEDLVRRELGPQGYAACAGAIGRHTLASRRFLDFLAARLDIPDDAARSLNRRFAA